MPNSVSAQNDSVSFTFLNQDFQENGKSGSYQLKSDFNISSNSINMEMFADYLFKTSFSEQAKDKFLEKQTAKTNVLQNWSSKINYKLTDSLVLYLKHGTFVGYTSSKELTELLLFGNYNKKGEEVQANGFNWNRNTSFSVGINQKLKSWNKVKLFAGYGLLALTNYSQIRSKELSLFTEETGDYLDVDVNNLEYVQNQEGNILRGVGIDLNATVKYYPNQINEFILAVKNINPTYLFIGDVLKFDSSLRFEGYNVNVLDLNDLESEIDSTFDNVIARAQEKNHFAFLPSNINLTWNKRLKAGDRLLTRLVLNGLGRYGASLGLGYTALTKKGFAINSELEFGTFSNLQWNESIEYASPNGFNLYVSLRGINGLLMQQNSYSSGAVFGFSRRL